MTQDGYNHNEIIGANGLDFEKIVRSTVANEVARDNRQCPDKPVGCISEFNEKADWSFVAKSVFTRDRRRPCIILVLESPHRDEYSNKCLYTPWPANGPTGRHIRKRAHLLIPPEWNSRQTELVLMNAVPYQCSLGKKTSSHRDAVFRAFWQAGGRVLFQQRLLHWYSNGDLIVNACTKGNSDPPLRLDVEAAIIEILPSALRLRRSHPFGWMTDAAANKEW